jgi:hypothetical protein
VAREWSSRTPTRPSWPCRPSTTLAATASSCAGASGATIINVRSAGNSGTGIRITNSTIAAGSAWLSSANGTNDVWFEGNSRAASLTGVVVGWTPCGLGAFQGWRENPWRVDATASAPVTGLRVNKKTNDYCVVPKTGN